MQVPMEKLMKPYDKEYMKMAMLKHEETFRHQVYELHRLYRIQKLMMKSIGNSRPNGDNRERWDSRRSGIRLNQIDRFPLKSRLGFDTEMQPGEEYIAESDGEVALEVEDERETQLTLGPPSYYRRKKAETPPTSDSGPSFSSSSNGSSSMKRTSSGLTVAPGSVSASQIGRKSRFEVEDDQLSQDRLKQLAPWLLKPVSLDMA